MTAAVRRRTVAREELEKKVRLLELTASGERHDDLPGTLTVVTFLRWTSEAVGVGPTSLFTLYSPEDGEHLTRVIAALRRLERERRQS